MNTEGIKYLIDKLVEVSKNVGHEEIKKKDIIRMEQGLDHFRSLDKVKDDEIKKLKIKLEISEAVEQRIREMLSSFGVEDCPLEDAIRVVLHKLNTLVKTKEVEIVKLQENNKSTLYKKETYKDLLDEVVTVLGLKESDYVFIYNALTKLKQYYTMFKELHALVDADGHLSDNQALERMKEYIGHYKLYRELKHKLLEVDYKDRQDDLTHEQTLEYIDKERKLFDEIDAEATKNDHWERKYKRLVAHIKRCEKNGTKIEDILSLHKENEDKLKESIAKSKKFI